MKKNLFILSLLCGGLSLISQTPRLSLFEEFTGETCPPCAATNPALNVLLHSATNLPKIVSIKWQVPIPSAPSNTWSLYQTNKTEIDWRYKSSPTGYGYMSQWSNTYTPTSGINAAPTGVIDGQHQWVFGAPTDHPVYLTDNIIATAQSYTSAFSITMTRDWDMTGSAVNVTVNIQATANFTAVGALVFRCVMVEELINFSTQPGSNGEKTFQDAAIKSFPSIQAGTPMAGVWTIGQNQTFVLNCPIPSYTRNKDQIAFVGFIQDDGTRKVAQACRASKAAIPNDAVAVSAKIGATCTSTLMPQITVMNNGTVAITALTITPYVDGISQAPFAWSGNIAASASSVIALNTLTTSTNSGQHAFYYTIIAMNGYDFNLTNNTAKVNFVVASNYQGTPVAEGFESASFPPASWAIINPDGGSSWSKELVNGYQEGAFGLSASSTKYDFFNNTVANDKDEFYLPPMDLTGTGAPSMHFDWSYMQRTTGSNDQLEVFFSNNCGASWTNVFNRLGPNLNTTGTVSASPYTPDQNQPSTWSGVDLNSELVGFNTANVLVKFVATADGNGNNLYIDNINLVQNNIVGLKNAGANRNAISVFPNPSNGLTTINIISASVDNAKVSLINTLGQVVLSKNFSIESGNNNIVIDVKDFATGIYNVTIDTREGSTVKKLTIVK